MIRALVNGSWETFEDARLQPGTDSFDFGTGLYETLRTKDNQPILLDSHLDRLLNTAESKNLKPSFHRNQIQSMISEVIKNLSNKDQRVRILLVPEKIIIYSTPLELDHRIYDGVSVITLQGKRDEPHIKTTNRHVCLNAYQAAQQQNCFDSILLDENETVLEGSRSNVFWVKDNCLFTRETGVLPGITRQTILLNSPFPVRYGKLKLLDFGWLSEVFLTNSGSGIIPVIKVNNSPIGNGRPGPITRKLLSLYDNWIFNRSKTSL